MNKSLAIKSIYMGLNQLRERKEQILKMFCMGLERDSDEGINLMGEIGDIEIRIALLEEQKDAQAFYSELDRTDEGYNR